MKLNSRKKRQLKLQNSAYIILLITLLSLLAYISSRYTLQTDWSFAQRNTLSETSRRLLAEMPDEIHITAFITHNEKLRAAIQALIGRYQRYKNNIHLEFINPQTNPARARALNATQKDTVILSYRNHKQQLQTLNENTLSLALQRLLLDKKHMIVFLSGHGEREPLGKANHHLLTFSQRLEEKGYLLQTLNLAETPSIPDNTQVLTIADPRTPLLDGEISILQRYIQQGGNLLWLHESDHPQPLTPLAEQLGIRFLPGTIVNITAQKLKIQIDFALISTYPEHPVTQFMHNLTLFPQAVGLEPETENTPAFRYTSLLKTAPDSWTETSPITGTIRFNENSSERAGPITLAAALERKTTANKQQRIIITGDSDFLANAYIGNGGNLELGLHMLDWLSNQDALTRLKPITAPDRQLQLSEPALAFGSLLFLILLPITLIATGLIIWWRRRRS